MLLKVLKAWILDQNNKLAYPTRLLLHSKLTVARLKLESNHSTTTAKSSFPTNLLMQPLIFFMANVRMTDDGANQEHNNLAKQLQLNDLKQRARLEQMKRIGVPGQHPQQSLMKTALTPNSLNTPDANDNCKCKGGMKGMNGQRIAMKIVSNSEENKKKIIFNIIFNILSCTCNISCNMFVESRLCTQANKNEIKCRLEVEGKDRCKDNRNMRSSKKMQKQNIPLYVETRYSTLCGKQDIPLQCGKQASTSCGPKSFYPPCVGRDFCFKPTIFNLYYQLDLYQFDIYQNKLLLNINKMHMENYIKSKHMNDIETNPGLREKLKVVTLNCWELVEINKF